MLFNRIRKKFKFSLRNIKTNQLKFTSVILKNKFIIEKINK